MVAEVAGLRRGAKPGGSGTAFTRWTRLQGSGCWTDAEAADHGRFTKLMNAEARGVFDDDLAAAVSGAVEAAG